MNRGLRAVVIPDLITSAELTGMSTFTSIKHLYDGLERAGLRQFVEWLIPSDKNHVTWDDSWFDEPWINTRPWLFPYEPMYDYSGFSPATLEPFLPKRGDVVADYVLNIRPLHSAEIASAFQPSQSQWVQTVELPVISWVIDSPLDPRTPAMRTRASEALFCASALQGPMIFMNEIDRDEYYRMLLRYLHPGVVGGLDMAVVNPTADFATIDDQYAEIMGHRFARRKRGVTTVFHGGSGEGKRRLPFIIEAVDELRAAGHSVEAVFKTQWKQTRKPPFRLAEDHDFSVEYQVGHDRFVESLWEGDIAYIGAEYEVTGLSYMEAIRAGQLPLVFDAQWMHNRLPAQYPFVTEDKTEAKLMLREMVTDFDDLITKWHEQLIFALDPFSELFVAGEFDRTVRRMLEPAHARNLEYVQKQNPGYNLLAWAVKEEQWPTITDPEVLWEAMSNRSEKRVNFKYVRPLALRLMLMTLGYGDTLDGPGLRMELRDG